MDGIENDRNDWYLGSWMEHDSNSLCRRLFVEHDLEWLWMIHTAGLQSVIDPWWLRGSMLSAPRIYGGCHILVGLPTKQWRCVSSTISQSLIGTGILCMTTGTDCHDRTPIRPGWWFETFLIFPYIGNNHPNWLTHIFQRGSYTTNQSTLVGCF